MPTLRTALVTPTLFVGDAPALTAARVAVTAQEAVRVMESGLIAVLPHGAWSEAHETLTLLGLDEQAIAAALHFGRTGRLIGQAQEEFAPDSR